MKRSALGLSDKLEMKTLDECAATHVVAAFDPRLDGKLLVRRTVGGTFANKHARL